MERYEMMDDKEDWHAIMHEEKMMVKSEISGRCSEVVGRVKSSGWDQLPEGFEKKEYASQAVKEGSGRGGRGAPQWANLTGRGASMSSNNSRIMTSQFSAGPGRGSLVRNDPPAERVRSDSAWSRDHQLHGRRQVSLSVVICQWWQLLSTVDLGMLRCFRILPVCCEES